MKGHTSVIRALLQKGAPVDAVTKVANNSKNPLSLLLVCVPVKNLTFYSTSVDLQIMINRGKKMSIDRLLMKVNASLSLV